MSSGTGPPVDVRVRHLLASHFEIALAALLVLAAAGGAVAVREATAPDTRTEQRVTGNWTSNATFAHRATAREDAIVFERGQVLRNRSLYFTRVAPVLNGTYVYRHSGEVAPATVDVDLRLVLRSVPAGEGERAYWRVEERLASVSARVDPGESLRVPFSMNVSRLANRSERINRRLQANPGRTHAVVVAETRANTTLGGTAVSDRRVDRLLVEPSTATYTVAQNASGAYARGATTRVSVPVPTDTTELYGGALFALVGLAGAAALVSADRTDRLALDPATRREVEWARERAAFDEWISVGRVPPPDGERVVHIDTLADLVDVAIDSGRRVIEDAADDRFVVLDGHTRYVLETDSRPTADPSTAADEITDPGDGDEETAEQTVTRDGGPS